MKPIKMQLMGLLTGAALALAPVIAQAAESHMAEALKHATAAVKATDGKAIVEHAEAAKTHASAASEHLAAGITSLNDAIDHAKLNHIDLAKKSNAEAVAHLKAAR